MSDRELLEFAAKAADIFLTPETLARAFPKWKWDKDFEPRHEGELGMSGAVLVYDYDGKLSGTTREAWNPLADDGDEARLEAKLGLNVLWGSRTVAVGRKHFGPFGERYQEHNGDKQAARRRAGVRAAAEIGRKMP